MNKLVFTIILAIVLINLVGFVVFLNGNNPPANTQNQNPQNSIANVSQPLVEISSNVTSLELSTHNNKLDCWISFQGKVYDITAWLPRHPGSSQAIEPYCGKSKEFEDAFKDQHGLTQVNKLIQEGIYKGDLN